MSHFHDKPGIPPHTPAESLSEAVTESEEGVTTPQTNQKHNVGARSDPSENVAEPRFKSCRWHETQDNGSAYCGNRDVLPFAGKNGFNPDAWCPECKLYKLKRTTKKRSIDNYDDY